MKNQKIFKVLAYFSLIILLTLSMTGNLSSVIAQETGKLAVEQIDTASQVEVPDTALTEEDEPAAAERGNSLFSTVKSGGVLMIFIVLLGLVALTIIIERIIFFTKNRVWREDSLYAYMNEVIEKSNASYKEDLDDELRNAFQLYSNSLEKGLALLSGIGNIAPIVGFLGTVLGMISAFAAIAAATTVNAKVVAVGIQIALVTTAGGLLVAAPTLAMFYLFSHIIQVRYSLAETIIEQASDEMPRLSDRLCQD